MSHHDEQDGESVEEFRAVAELAEAFTSLVDHLTARRTVALDLETLMTFAHRMMPRTTHTGVIVQGHGRPRTAAATSGLLEQLDQLRIEVGEGPGLDVLEENDMVISGDLYSDPRWPTLGPRACQELGVHSVACYRLLLGPDHRAALMFVSDWPYAFDELAESIGAIFAAYCSLVLIANEMLGGQATPHTTAQVHREIGVAVGILLTREGLSPEQAYQRLHRASHSLARSLPDVAQHVLAHQRLPSDDSED
jgi:hypothetical protein